MVVERLLILFISKRPILNKELKLIKDTSMLSTAFLALIIMRKSTKR